MSERTLKPAIAANLEIVSSRVFHAPRALVFKAWTDPKHVERWWGPSGFQSIDCQLDLRPGGAFRLQMRSPDGVVYPCRGVFREIVAPERIVYVGDAGDGPACGAGLPPGSIVTVTFDDQDGKTLLTIRTLLPSAERRQAAIKAGVEPGWISCLDRLAEHLLGT